MHTIITLEQAMTKSTIFTVGHSNVEFDAFVGVLNKHNIDLLIDTRSHPGSKKYPHFGKENFEEKLGSRYLWMPSLGGSTKGVYSDPGVFPKHHICAARSDRDIFQAQISHGCNCDIESDSLVEIQALLSSSESRQLSVEQLTLSSLHHLHDRWPESILGSHRNICNAIRKQLGLSASAPLDTLYSSASYVPDSLVQGKILRNKNMGGTCVKCLRPFMVRQWYNVGLHDYSLWMADGTEFTDACVQLNTLASGQRAAVMCAEALWWKCHRSMISDYWEATGGEVYHLTASGKPRRHPTGDALNERLTRYEAVTRALWGDITTLP